MTLLVSGSDGPSPRAAPGPARPQTRTGILWRWGGGDHLSPLPRPLHTRLTPVRPLRCLPVDVRVESTSVTQRPSGRFG